MSIGVTVAGFTALYGPVEEGLRNAVVILFLIFAIAFVFFILLYKKCEKQD